MPQATISQLQASGFMGGGDESREADGAGGGGGSGGVGGRSSGPPAPLQFKLSFTEENKEQRRREKAESTVCVIS